MGLDENDVIEIQITDVGYVDDLLRLAVFVENHTSRHLDKIPPLLIKKVFELLLVQADEFLAAGRINDRQSMLDEIDILQLTDHHALAFPLTRGDQRFLEERSRVLVEPGKQNASVVVQVQGPSRPGARGHPLDGLEDASSNTLIGKHSRQHVRRLAGYGLRQRPKDAEGLLRLFPPETTIPPHRR